MSARRAAAVCVLALAALAACGGSGSTNEPLEGGQLVVDPKGDHAQALNADGVKPKNPLDSADIVGVRVDADRKELAVRIALGASPMKNLPADVMQGPSWFVQMWATDKTEGAPAYFVAIVRDGEAKQEGDKITGWRLSVCPGTQVCDEPAEGATLEIVGAEVRATIPLGVLSKLRNPFSWVALSYWNETQDPVQAHSDWVPEAARLAPGTSTYSKPDTRAVFPPKE